MAETKTQTKEKKKAPARKREVKLNICGITQQFEPNFWPGIKDFEDLAILKKVQDGGEIKPLLEMVVRRLEAAGCKVLDAYAIKHDKDVQVKWDETFMREVVAHKSNHGHFVIRFEKGQGGTVSTIADAVGVEEPFVEKASAGRYGHDNMLAYLVHAKYPDKYQYKPDEVAVIGKDAEAFEDIYKRQMPTWVKARGSIKKKAAATGIDDLEYKILTGQVVRSQVILTDELFEIYSRYKRRCDDAFATYGDRKAYKTMELLQTGQIKLTVFFIVGKPGSGKTSFVAKDLISKIQENARKRGEDWTVCYTAATNPLDEYNGEEIMLMDDVRGACMSAGDWLKLLDPYTITPSSARYHNKVPACRTIIITSTIEPVEFFRSFADSGEAMGQFVRRIQSLVRVIRADDRSGMSVEEIKKSIQLHISDSENKTGEWEFKKPKKMKYDDGLSMLADKVDKNNSVAQEKGETNNESRGQ